MARGTRLILFALNLFGKIPLALRIRIGRGLGLIFSLVPGRDAKIGALQQDLFIGDLGGRRNLRRVYRNMGQTVGESLNLAPYRKRMAETFFGFDWELGHALVAQGKGVVVLTGHFGNWDLLGAYTSWQGLPLVVVGREARSAALQEVLIRVRESYGVKTIWRANRLAAREIMRALESNQLVAALIDQDTRVSAVPAPFFGLEVSCPSSLVEIGLKQGSPIVSAFMARESDGRYRMYSAPIEQRGSAAEVLAEFNRRLEELIRRYPDQWVWFHKRWRTQGGRRLGSKEYIKYLERELRERR